MSLRSYFDRAAPHYATLIEPAYAPLAEALVKDAAIQPGERVLDLGTGSGLAARQALRFTRSAEVHSDLLPGEILFDHALELAAALAGEADDLAFALRVLDRIRRVRTVVHDVVPVVAAHRSAGGLLGIGRPER